MSQLPEGPKQQGLLEPALERPLQDKEKKTHVSRALDAGTTRSCSLTYGTASEPTLC